MAPNVAVPVAVLVTESASGVVYVAVQVIAVCGANEGVAGQLIVFGATILLSVTVGFVSVTLPVFVRT